MRMFSYIDEQNRLRGQFCEAQMHYWYLQKYLQPSMTIIVHEDLMGHQTTLEQLISRNGRSNPFSSNDRSTPLSNGDFQENENCENSELETDSVEVFYPFLEGTPSKDLKKEDILSAEGRATCFMRFEEVKSRYTVRRINNVLRNFGLMEKKKCVLCKKELYGAGMFDHCLRKQHYLKVLGSGRLFSFKDRDSFSKIIESVIHGPNGLPTTTTTTICKENGLYMADEESVEIVSRHFSYIDKSGNFRGPFTAKCMQQWYDNGFFKDVLQVFIHRGHVADLFTLEDLCTRNGDVTPFFFLEPSQNCTSGFRECPPGVTLEEKKSCFLEKFVQCPDCEAEVMISPSEAGKAKAWPLLSRPRINYPRTKKRKWIISNFQFLQKEILHCDLTQIDNDPQNNDLRKAVCQLCFVRLLAPSDVLKHLALKSHQDKVIEQCLISGTEFNEYYKRLARVRLESIRWMAEVMKISAISMLNPEQAEEENSPAMQWMLMQSAPSRSNELTDKELETEIENLRQLAVKVNVKKFIELFRDKIVSRRCAFCYANTKQPMDVLTHHLSKRHWEKVKEKGFKVTQSDIELWKQQILAGK